MRTGRLLLVSLLVTFAMVPMVTKVDAGVIGIGSVCCSDYECWFWCRCCWRAWEHEVGHIEDEAAKLEQWGPKPADLDYRGVEKIKGDKAAKGEPWGTKQAYLGDPELEQGKEFEQSQNVSSWENSDQ